jgi:hypothetical protein
VAAVDEEEAQNDPVPVASSSRGKRKADDVEDLAPSGRDGRPRMPSPSRNAVQTMTLKRKRELSASPERRRPGPPIATRAQAEDQQKVGAQAKGAKDEATLLPVPPPLRRFPAKPDQRHQHPLYMDLAYIASDRRGKNFRRKAPLAVTNNVPLTVPVKTPAGRAGGVKYEPKGKEEHEEGEIAAEDSQPKPDAGTEIIGYAYAIEQKPPRLPWGYLDHLPEAERQRREIWADLFGTENGVYKRFSAADRLWINLAHHRAVPKAWKIPQGWVPQNPLGNQLLSHMLSTWEHCLERLEVRAAWMDLFRDVSAQ